MADRTSLEALTELLAKAPERQFAESVEVAVNIKELDLADPKNRIEDDIPLPNGRGKPVKIVLFGSAEMSQKVKGVADLTVAPAQMDELFKDKKSAKKLIAQYDFFLAEAPLMPVIGRRLGVVLGPRGKMPRPIPPGSDPTNLITALKRSIRIRSKGKRTFHASLGIRTMPAEALAQNLDAVLGRIVAKLERGRTNVESVYVKTTMGPAVRVW